MATSLLVIIFTVSLSNSGTINSKAAGLVPVSVATCVLHLAKLGISTMKAQSRAAPLQTSLTMATSIILKTLSVIVLLSTTSENAVYIGILAFLAVLAVNWILENAARGPVDEEEMKVAWVRAVHSTIFPLALKRETKKAYWSRVLQIMSGNIAVVLLSFSVAMEVGVTEKLFMTGNMVKALGVTASLLLILLILHSLLASLGFTSEPALEDNDDLEEALVDVDEETPVLNSQQEPETRFYERKKIGLNILFTSSLLLTLSLPYPLLLHVFNSCPTLPSSQHTTITCTSTSPTVGSRCSVSCSPLYWSSSSPQSSCTWRGVWSVELGCRRQAAAVIGPAQTDEDDKWRATVEVYPPTSNSSTLPPLPRDYVYGSTGYISGGLHHCGGIDSDDPSITPTSSCYHLTPPLQWEETHPLLQVILLP